MDITSLKPFLCKIKVLWFFNTELYDVQSLYSLMSHVSNCSDGNIETILFDYFHRKRDFDYIIANELALKSIFNVKKMIIRIHSNNHRAAELIQRNVLEHSHLPLFRLAHLTFIIQSLDYRFCVLLQEILLYIQVIEIIPFNDVVLNGQVVEFCKNKFVDSIKSLTEKKIQKVIIQGWNLNVWDDKMIWEKLNELVIGKEKNSPEYELILKIVLLANMLLSSFISLIFAAVSFFESWFYGDWQNSFFVSSEKGQMTMINEFVAVILFLFMCYIFFGCLILHHYIPGELFWSCKDPIFT